MAEVTRATGLTLDKVSIPVEQDTAGDKAFVTRPVNRKIQLRVGNQIVAVPSLVTNAVTARST
jgi:hypothetical protein